MATMWSRPRPRGQCLQAKAKATTPRPRPRPQPPRPQPSRPRPRPTFCGLRPRPRPNITGRHFILLFHSLLGGCVDFTFFDPQTDCVMTEHVCVLCLQVIFLLLKRNLIMFVVYRFNTHQHFQHVSQYEFLTFNVRESDEVCCHGRQCTRIEYELERRQNTTDIQDS